MRLLNLVIYNDNTYYRSMLEFHSAYCLSRTNVDTFYITFNPAQKERARLENQIISIRGEESVTPGLLLKTIESALLLDKRIENYDFVLRSNISTVVNFRLLEQFIPLLHDHHYFGAKALQLSWLDQASGIVDSRHFGTPFVTGSCMFFSPHLFSQVLSLRHYLDFSIIDDVSIGILLKNFFPEVSLLQFPQHMVFGYDGEMEGLQTLSDVECRSKLAFRFKSENRMHDVDHIRRLAALL
jgi:hypothetical protein